MSYFFSWDHWRLKYTEVQSQEMAFTRSPSSSNNLEILNNYLIFTFVFLFFKEMMNKLAVRSTDDKKVVNMNCLFLTFCLFFTRYILLVFLSFFFYHLFLAETFILCGLRMTKRWWPRGRRAQESTTGKIWVVQQRPVALTQIW